MILKERRRVLAPGEDLAESMTVAVEKRDEVVLRGIGLILTHADLALDRGRYDAGASETRSARAQELFSGTCNDSVVHYV